MKFAQISKTDAILADMAKFNAHIGTLITHITSEDKKLGMFLYDK